MSHVSKQSETGVEWTSRQSRRAERIAKRNARIAARNQQSHHAPPGFFTTNVDPLLVTDRDGNAADLRGLWAGASGFLVCGGPSTKAISDLGERLRDRGIVSLAVNNAAAHLPVRAMTFSDPPEKFHYGIFCDPALMKFVPKPKLRRGQVRLKLPDGRFKFSGLHAKDFPNVWGYERNCEFRAKEFLTAQAATWGNNNQGVKATGGEKLLFSMFLGVRLLHYLGCRRVFLLGADFRMAPDSGYAFAQKRDADAAASNNNSYRVANIFFKSLRPVFEQASFTVENCNPASALEAFDYRDVGEAFRLAKGFTPPTLDLCGWYESKGEG